MSLGFTIFLLIGLLAFWVLVFLMAFVIPFWIHISIMDKLKPKKLIDENPVSDKE